MISNDVFANTFGTVPAGDTEKLRKLAILAVKNGFAVVLVRPRDKAPLACSAWRSEAQIKRADTEAQETAKSAGEANWRRATHKCGAAHAFTDAAEIGRVMQRLAAKGITPNLGVHLRRSRMIVVDVDTTAEKDAFLLAWSEATGEHMTGLTPTVLSPGAIVNGEWKHKHGGHFWFTLPEDFELPTSTGEIRGEGRWVIKWGDSQVLVPPSSRPEGEYKLVGQAVQLPLWLREFIEQRAKRDGNDQPAREIRGSGSTTDWAAGTPWASLLIPDGWTATGRLDTCGCPTFTAPGDHGDPKSATAHEVGCSRYPDEQVNAPLHIWTDNPPDFVRDAIEARGGKKTMSKLNYVAFRDHGGDTDAAKAALGITDEADGAPDDRSFDGMFAEGEAPTAAPAKTSVTLPDGFWEARRELRHIRQAAWARDVSPDAALYAVLARLASQLPGDLRVDSGTKEAISLNFYGAVIGGTGDSKSTSAGVGSRLVPTPDWLEPTAFGEVRYRDRATLGTGEGLAEAYMGLAEVVVGLDKRGDEKTAQRRLQVRHNAFMYVDEGESLTAQMNRENQTLGQTIRTAWRGVDPIGQTNGSAERSRHVENYAFGLIIGYQPDTAFPLLDGEVLGTPQRFMWCRATIDGNPEEPPEHPGPLWKPDRLAGLLGFDTDPAVVGDGIPLLGERAEITVTMPTALKIKARGEARGARKLPRLDSQRPVSLIKVSGLLALLSGGRTEITEEDWELAVTMWGTSCAVRDALAAEKSRNRKKAADVRAQTKAAEAVAVQAATDQVVRVARVLFNAVIRHGPDTPGALKKNRVASRDKKISSEALDYAMARGWLAEDDGKIVKGDSQPVAE